MMTKRLLTFILLFICAIEYAAAQQQNDNHTNTNHTNTNNNDTPHQDQQQSFWAQVQAFTWEYLNWCATQTNTNGNTQFILTLQLANDPLVRTIFAGYDQCTDFLRKMRFTANAMGGAKIQILGNPSRMVRVRVEGEGWLGLEMKEKAG